jgi:hypothetical protein
MREAVERVVDRKFGPGGPFHRDTPDPWRDNLAVRGSAPVHDEEFKECIMLITQYVYDRFGKFPWTVLTMWAKMYLRAYYLDLEFYDTKFGPEAYLDIHAEHITRWHTGSE